MKVSFTVLLHADTGVYAGKKMIVIFLWAQENLQDQRVNQEQTRITDACVLFTGKRNRLTATLGEFYLNVVSFSQMSCVE